MTSVRALLDNPPVTQGSPMGGDPPDPTTERLSSLLSRSDRISAKLGRINRQLDRRQRYAPLYGLARILAVFLVVWAVAGVVLKLASG